MKKTKTKSRSSPHVSTIPDVTRVHDLGEQSWDWSQIYLSRLRYVLPLILIALLPLDKRPLAITGPWNTVATGPHDFLFFFFLPKGCYASEATRHRSLANEYTRFDNKSTSLYNRFGQVIMNFHRESVRCEMSRQFRNPRTFVKDLASFLKGNVKRSPWKRKSLVWRYGESMYKEQREKRSAQRPWPKWKYSSPSNIFLSLISFSPGNNAQLLRNMYRNI